MDITFEGWDTVTMLALMGSGTGAGCESCSGEELGDCMQLYTVQGTMDTVHCTRYNVHCTLYTVHCTLYNLHCKQFTYTIHCINSIQ